MTIDDTFKQKILDDIHKTGFDKELQVASIINQKKGWFARQNSSYFDKDLQTSREIDIIAGKHVLKSNLEFATRLIIEVKLSKRPWIIFTRPSEHQNPGWGVIHYDKNLRGAINYSQIGKSIMRRNNIRIGTTFYEAFKSPHEPSQTFEAIINSCKASFALRNSTEQEWEDIFKEVKESRRDRILFFFFPVIVLHGILLEAFLDEEGEIQIEQRNYIPVEFYFGSPNYTTWSGDTDITDNTFYPDIVTYEGLDNYLSLADKWHQNIYKILRNS